MLGAADIGATHWIVFVVAILIFLTLDLGVFHRKAHVVGVREALLWTAIWFVIAMAFGLLIAPAALDDWHRPQDRALSRPAREPGQGRCPGA